MIVFNRLKKTIYHLFILVLAYYTKPTAVTMNLLYQAVQDLGGVYVKFMQFLCLRLEMFDDDVKIQFVKLYDQVDQEEMDVEEILFQELGEKRQLLKEVEKTPFATGSFAQVYKAKLQDGRSVVVKVRRADQHQKVTFDFFLMTIVCRVILLLFDFEQIDLLQLFKEFKKTTFQELEYKLELQHAQYFFEQYRNHPQIVIPETFAELCTNNVLVQEYVQGIPLTQVITWKQQRTDYHTFLEEQYGINLEMVFFSIATEVIRQHLTFDKFYGDSHPGNIILLPQNKFAFIDFGILDQTASDKKEYFTLMKTLGQPIEQLNEESMSQQFLKLGARSLYQSLEVIEKSLGQTEQSSKLTDLIKAEYAQLIADCKDSLISQELEKREDLTGLVMQIAELGKKFQIQMPTGFFNVIRSSTMFKSFTSYLAPDYHYMRQVYRELAAEYEHVPLSEKRQPRKFSFEESVETVMDWLSSIAEADLPLYLQIHGILEGKNYAK